MALLVILCLLAWLAIFAAAVWYSRHATAPVVPKGPTFEFEEVRGEVVCVGPDGEHYCAPGFRRYVDAITGQKVEVPQNYYVLWERSGGSLKSRWSAGGRTYGWAIHPKWKQLVVQTLSGQTTNPNAKTMTLEESAEAQSELAKRQVEQWPTYLQFPDGESSDPLIEKYAPRIWKAEGEGKEEETRRLMSDFAHEAAMRQHIRNLMAPEEK